MRTQGAQGSGCSLWSGGYICLGLVGVFRGSVKGNNTICCTSEKKVPSGRSKRSCTGERNDPVQGNQYPAREKKVLYRGNK